MKEEKIVIRKDFKRLTFAKWRTPSKMIQKRMNQLTTLETSIKNHPKYFKDATASNPNALKIIANALLKVFYFLRRKKMQLALQVHGMLKSQRKRVSIAREP